MELTDEQVNAQRNFDAASLKVKKALTTSGGGTGAENEYSAAHTALVRLGLAMPLRAKYRR